MRSLTIGPVGAVISLAQLLYCCIRSISYMALLLYIGTTELAATAAAHNVVLLYDMYEQQQHWHHRVSLIYVMHSHDISKRTAVCSTTVSMVCGWYRKAATRVRRYAHFWLQVEKLASPDV